MKNKKIKVVGPKPEDLKPSEKLESKLKELSLWEKMSAKKKFILGVPDHEG